MDMVEMEDYIYDGNKKEFIYKGKTAPKAKVIMTQNSKSERESQIWMFEMDKKIKQILNCLYKKYKI